ncbi:MAG: ATP-binding protein [Acidobacteriota bacterium]
MDYATLGGDILANIGSVESLYQYAIERKLDPVFLWEQAVQAIQVYDNSLRLVYANPAYLKYSGMSSTDLLGKTFEQVIKFVYTDLRILSIDNSGITKSNPISVKCHGVLRSGKESDFRSTLFIITDQNNELLGMLDVMEAEDFDSVRVDPFFQSKNGKLMDNIIGLLELVEDYKDAVLICDNDLHLYYANDKLQNIIGTPKNELIGIGASEILMRLGSPIDIEEARRIAVSGQPTKYIDEFPAVMSDGRGIDLRIHIIPLGSLEEGRCPIMIMLEDIGREKARHRSNEMVRRFSLVEEMAGSIAHEIRNPMTVVRGMAQLMIEKHPGSKKDLEMMIEEIDRANGLMSQLLEVASKQPMPSAAVDMMDVLRGAIESCHLLIINSGVKISIEFDYPSKILVHGDGEQLRQTLVHVLKNAIEASESGQTVSIVNDQFEGRWRVRIIDRGIGMSVEVKERAFSPCFSAKKNGLGLGLSFAYRVIKDHGGEIWLHSVEGQGTEVTFTLPFANKRD